MIGVETKANFYEVDLTSDNWKRKGFEGFYPAEPIEEDGEEADT